MSFFKEIQPEDIQKNLELLEEVLKDNKNQEQLIEEIVGLKANQKLNFSFPKNGNIRLIGEPLFKTINYHYVTKEDIDTGKFIVKNKST